MLIASPAKPHLHSLAFRDLFTLSCPSLSATADPLATPHTSWHFPLASSDVFLPAVINFYIHQPSGVKGLFPFLRPAQLPLTHKTPWLVTHVVTWAGVYKHQSPDQVPPEP